MDRRGDGEGINNDVLRHIASYQEIVMMDQARADKIYDLIKSRKGMTMSFEDYDIGLKKDDDLTKLPLATIIISAMRVEIYNLGRFLSHCQHQ